MISPDSSQHLTDSFPRNINGRTTFEMGMNPWLPSADLGRSAFFRPGSAVGGPGVGATLKGGAPTLCFLGPVGSKVIINECYSKAICQIKS